MIDASFDAPKRLLQFATVFSPCFTKRTFASFVLYLCVHVAVHDEKDGLLRHAAAIRNIQKSDIHPLAVF